MRKSILTILPSKNIQNYLQQALILFFIGITGQFLAHTIITYGIGIPDTGIWSIIWVWKEILVLLVGLSILVLLYYRKSLFILRDDINIRRSIISILLGLIIAGINSFFIHDQTIGTFFVSVKFTYFPLVIYIIGLLSRQILAPQQQEKILSLIITIIKTVLIFGVARYLLLHTFSNGLDLIGYSQPGASIERTANTPPPSLWLTDFYTGYVRNQGPFGGPLSYGFWLACLRPLFFAKVLFKKPLSQTRARRLLYSINIISTFSRAGRIMFAISSCGLMIIMGKKWRTRTLLGGIGLTVLIALYIKLGGSLDVFLRTRSDSGHKEFLLQGLRLLQQHRLRGIGAASVGPASYHIPGENYFNPENQYMQIWLEYGLMGIITWIGAYRTSIHTHIKKYFSLFKSVSITPDDIVHIVPALALGSLAVANLVLHPMTDSSTMYPLMMIIGLISPIKIEKKTTLSQTTTVIPMDKESESNKHYRKLVPDIMTILLYILGFFFVLQTFFVYGSRLIASTLTISIVRDIVFGSGIIFSLFYYYKDIKNFLQIHWKIIISTALLCSIGIYHYLIGYNNYDIMSFIAGIKFDLHYIFLLVGGLRIGYILSSYHQGVVMQTLLKRYIPFIAIIILGGIIWQITKNIRPDFFTTTMGMSLPRDFVPFSNPPIYYITGPGGIQRLSGLFVGPNTLGFFLVAMFAYIISWLRRRKPHHQIITILLYIVITALTLSRGAVLGIAIESIVFIRGWQFFRGNDKLLSFKKKVIISTGIIIGTWLLISGINTRKTSSNQERTGSLSSSIIAILQEQPLLGQGPGYVGPGKHYEQSYLANQKNNLSMIENIYLQITINLGFIGLIMRGAIRYQIIYYHYCIRTIKKGDALLGDKDKKNSLSDNAVRYRSLGLLGLGSIGMFLHVFIDSMVNYIFFVMYGMLVSYTLHTSQSFVNQKTIT